MDVHMLPSPEPSDSSETRSALETARTLWGQGEAREALQWIRRAAEAAAESGQDDRALLLAKHGAELRGTLDIPRTVPPVAPQAVQVTQVPSPPQHPVPSPIGARVSSIPPSSESGGEVVVTLVSDEHPSSSPRSTLLSHRAVRVAVLPSLDGTDELRVRRLAPGELAPRDAKVALLVSLEPGEAPLPEPT